MCELSCMENLSVKALVEAVGISKGYASDILNQKQAPSRPLAIHIFRATGWRHAVISDLTNEQIDVLESVEPYKPKTPAPPSEAT